MARSAITGATSRLMIVGLAPLLLLAVRAQVIEQPPTALFEVPARFEMGCPILSLDLASEQHGRQPLDFLLDSGATRSMLLNAGVGKERTFEQGKRGLLIPGSSTLYAGFQDFAAPDLAQFNQDLVDRLSRLHVQGILAADFLSNHDVLIDYGAKRVFLSRPIEASPAGSLPNLITLVGATVQGGALTRHHTVPTSRASEVTVEAEGRKFYLDASLVEGNGGAWRMRFDTWASRSTLSTSMASRLKRTGASERVSAAGASFDAEQVEATVSLGKGLSVDLKPVATDAVESILGSDAFRDRTLLLQLGHSRLKVWAESVLAKFERESG